ncbi:hypothetical protein WJX73_005748 [Symbiochloris irregularis]|uniref:Glycerol-3-phosphate dehydrogenase [NAD(+)] n=1 Tax=Symbiochloris irregularis TaxID=706552 RepID=A0AAW1PQU8_9CHLO
MIVYLLVRLIVFPSTGTDLALRQLAAAMGHLKAMHEAIWHSAFLVMLQEPSHHDSRKGLTGVQKLSGIRKMSIQSSKADEDDLSRPLVAVVLEHLDALVLALRKFDDNMAFAKSERYVTTLKRPVYMRLYLPVLKWLNKDAKGLPVEQLQAVRRSIRHASRCLWTLSLAVGDVPQPPMVRRMRSRHGAAVFEELGLSQAAAMQDIASSFKLDEAIEEYCSSDNVLRMLEALEVLLSKNAQHWQGLPLWSEEQPANGDTGGPNFALLQSDASHDLDDKQPSGSIAVDLNGRYPSQAEVRRRSNEAAGPARSAAADDKGLHRPLMPLSNYDKGDEGFFMKMRFNTFLFSPADSSSQQQRFEPQERLCSSDAASSSSQQSAVAVSLSNGAATSSAEADVPAHSAESSLHHIEVPARLQRNKSSASADLARDLGLDGDPYSQHGGVFYPPAESNRIRGSWKQLMRWSRILGRSENGDSVLDKTDKVVVFGGGSFGTAMAVSLARQKKDLNVTMLLRDPYICKSINTAHQNSRYLQGYKLPSNVVATTAAQEAIEGAQYALHAVPVQHSREFLSGIADILPKHVPVISVSKGLERGTGALMSDVIAATLGNKHPCAFLSGPSFAKEVMDQRPTGIVAASKDKKLARVMQGLFASPALRVNTSTDVVGVEICGALKNVLAIAAGIVEGLDLGHNAMAALIAQGCSEIRWLAEKMGAKPETVSGLSGLGDIMLTCYGSLSRNRSVGIRLAKGDQLCDIVGSSHQVAEGVSTAGVVVALALRMHVSLPVLTAVAQVLDGALTPTQAVADIMTLPQIEEK